MASTSVHSQSRKALKRPDQFFKAVSRLFDQLIGHKGVFFISIGALFAAGLFGAYLASHLEKRNELARNALYLADKELGNELKALAPQSPPNPAAGTNKATPESVTFKKLDVDSVLAGAVKQFQVIDQDFGRTRAAFEARLKLGDLYYNHGDYNKALPWYTKAVQSSPASLEKSLALSSVGYTYENLGKYSEAIQNYQQALYSGEPSIKGDTLLGLARCYEATHDTAKARSTYDQILTDLPNTEYSKSAEAYKARLQ